MNWSIVAILVTIGLAQAGFVVVLVDRLFKAEIRILTVAIEALQKELARRDHADDARDAEMRDVQARLRSLEDWRAGL